MKYQQERKQIQIKNVSRFLKIISIKIASIIIAVMLILALIFSISFFRNVIFGELSMSEFKNSFFGIPTNKLLQINQQIENQYDTLKQWFSNLKSRISS